MHQGMVVLVVCSTVKVDVSCVGADRLPYFSRGIDVEFTENEQQQIHSPDGTTQRLSAHQHHIRRSEMFIQQHIFKSYNI